MGRGALRSQYPKAGKQSPQRVCSTGGGDRTKVTDQTVPAAGRRKAEDCPAGDWLNTGSSPKAGAAKARRLLKRIPIRGPGDRSAEQNRSPPPFCQRLTQLPFCRSRNQPTRGRDRSRCGVIQFALWLLKTRYHSENEVFS